MATTGGRTLSGSGAKEAALGDNTTAVTTACTEYPFSLCCFFIGLSGFRHWTPLTGSCTYIGEGVSEVQAPGDVRKQYKGMEVGEVFCFASPPKPSLCL